MISSRSRVLWLLPVMLLGALFTSACAGTLPADLPPGVELELGSAGSGMLARVEFTGLVEAMAPEAWTVSGQVVGITPQTEILGTIAVGDSVKVEAEVGPDGVLMAREIKPALGAGRGPECGGRRGQGGSGGRPRRRADGPRDQARPWRRRGARPGEGHL